MDQKRNTRVLKNQDPINQFIKSNSIVIIDAEGSKSDVLTKSQALRMAENENLDLVQVGTQPGGITIAKIMDYGKYKYHQQKKLKETKKNSSKTENKEIRLTVNIGQHDLETKARKAREFLEDGDRVKVSLKFKGREIVYLELGEKTLQKFYSLVEDVCKVEKAPKLNSRFLDMYITPIKK